tara:strand:+ start:138 stop:407 length:270 start_codon:yes stop_codon:yes gene_type:complete
MQEILDITSSLPFGDEENLNFANGWGVGVGLMMADCGQRFFRLTVLKDGYQYYDDDSEWRWITEADVARLSAIVKSWAPNQTFPEWEEE